MAGTSLTVSNVPNNYVETVDPSSTSLGDIVDTGATQSGSSIEFELGGVSTDGACVDILDSQDGSTFFHLYRLYSGQWATVVKGVNRYLRTLRQKGTRATTVQWGKPSPSGGGGTDIFWANGGNSFGGGVATLGTLDGDSLQIFVGNLSNVIIDSDGANVLVKAPTGGGGNVQIDGSERSIQLVGPTSLASSSVEPDGATILDSSSVTDLGWAPPQITASDLAGITDPPSGMFAFESTHAIILANCGTPSAKKYRKMAGGPFFSATNTTTPTFLTSTRVSITGWTVDANTNLDGSFDGTTFTVPIDGFYTFFAQIELAAGTMDQSTITQLSITVNGANTRTGEYITPVADVSQKRVITVSGPPFWCTAGQQIRVAYQQTVGGTSQTLSGAPTLNYFSGYLAT